MVTPTEEKPTLIEQRLIARAMRRCSVNAVVLLALQIGMWHAVTQDRDIAGADRCEVPARLSLLLDFGFVITVLALTIRTCEYLRASSATRTCTWAGRLAASAVAAAAVANAVENVILWRRFDHGIALKGRCDSLTVVPLTPVWWIVGGVGALVLLAATVSAHRRLSKGVESPMRQADLAPLVQPEEAVEIAQAASRVLDKVTPGAIASSTRTPPNPPAGPNTVIACSGGGIRSASFCLGALQALSHVGIYRQASAVVGVSGGGYMAAAFHLGRKGLAPTDDPPFAPGTPELALLRRNTRYLLPRGVEIYRGILSILFGVCVNIVIIGATLRLLSWVLGWYLHYTHVVRVVALDVPKGADYTSDQQIKIDPSLTWVLVALAPWIISAAAFVLVEKVLDRIWTVTDKVRRSTHALIQACLGAGYASVVLMLVVPYTLRFLSIRNKGVGTIPDILEQFISPDLSGLGATAGLVAALIALGRSVLKGQNADHAAKDKPKVVSKLLAKVRTHLAPWLGTLLIVAVSYIVLLRWTNGYATDPTWRSDWSIVWKFGLVVLAVRILTDANRTSIHYFYRERLSNAYLVKRLGDESAKGGEYRGPVLFSERGARDNEGPALVMAASANVMDPEFVPTGRGCVPFIMDANLMGVVGDRSLPVHGQAVTALYERTADYDGRDVTIPASMAISGAAFSPLVGRQSSRTRPVRVLLTVLNARLGVWLPNPYGRAPRTIVKARELRAAYERDKDKKTVTAGEYGQLLAAEFAARLLSIASKPGPYRLLREAFGNPSLYDRKIYVTDGGHYDNLGLIEALRRRPDRIFVIDASNDAENLFSAMSDAIATARMDLGVEIDIDVKPLTSSEKARATAAWTLGTATHPDNLKTDVIFLKALLVGDLTWDLEHYSRRNLEFPRRSTSDQLYDEWDFEAYRGLGQTLATRMVKEFDLGGKDDD